MIYYDGHSDIEWFYDGLMSFGEMRNSVKYKEVTEVPVVLRDNGAGKVYGYIRADEYAKSWGLILNPQNPEKTIDEILAKQNGTWVDPLDVVAKLLMRSDISEDEARVMHNYYPEWKIGVDYKQGWVIRYNGNLYKIAQDHTSQSQWVPGETGTESLYTGITVSSEGYPYWQQPTGAHDAYNIGDIVLYKDKLYKSLINGNVWSPDVYPMGWEETDDSESPVDPPEEGDPDTPQSYPDFVQPTGAHDAYKKGDIVKYNGTLYKSLIDGNVWAPDAYPQGWEVYTEE